MHDKPETVNTPGAAGEPGPAPVSVETLLGELTAGDPAAAPEVADAIAARLESDLEAASPRTPAAEADLESA